ncbi:MAG TPA: YtxH domain-containing protein [Terriglobales bacterium]|nr:YtxH domain-containing protein [Terriglobales bacterium]
MHLGNQESDSNTVGTAVTFLLIGVGVGAVAALLLAPKTGKQLRKDLRRKYDDARETVEDWKQEAREAAEDAMERGGKLAGQIRDRVAPLAKAVARD